MSLFSGKSKWQPPAPTLYQVAKWLVDQYLNDRYPTRGESKGCATVEEYRKQIKETMDWLERNVSAEGVWK